MNRIEQFKQDHENEVAFQRAIKQAKLKGSLLSELGGMLWVYEMQIKEFVSWRFDVEIYQALCKAEPNNTDAEEQLANKLNGYKLKQLAVEIMRKQILDKLYESQRTKNKDK